MRPALSAFSLPKRRRAMRRQLQPDAVRLFYFSQLRALMSKAHALVTGDLLSLVHEMRSDAACWICERGLTHCASSCPRGRRRGDWIRRDVESADRVRLLAKAKELAHQFAPSITPNKLTALAQHVAGRTASFQKAQLQAQLKDAIGVNPFIRDAALERAMAHFVTENVALIRTVPERYFKEIETMVIGEVGDGTRATTIARQIEERYGVSETNAARIANDQVGKFYGLLNDTRQRELGITSAIWTTAHDSRVRDSHAALDGQSYDLGEGLEDEDTGETVLPGEAINCRCQGLPDMSAILGV